MALFIYMYLFIYVYLFIYFNEMLFYELYIQYVNCKGACKLPVNVELTCNGDIAKNCPP